MYTTFSELVVFMYRTGKSMNNILSYCGLVGARIRASNKDLPVKAAEVPEAFLNQEEIIKPTLPLEAFSNQEETIKPPSPITVPNND